MRGPVVRVNTDQGCNDDMRDSHEGSAPEQQGPTAEGIHGPDTGADADELGDVDDSRHEKLHVIVEPHCLEECWRVVDEGVDANELGTLVSRNSGNLVRKENYLLEEHNKNSNMSPSPAATLEAVGP